MTSTSKGNLCNPFLKGACAQQRCRNCNRILAMGRCLEGCDSKPPEVKCEIGETEVAPPPPAPLDAPTFSDLQRQQAAEGIARRIEAERSDAAVENAQDAPSVSRKRRAPGEERPAQRHVRHAPGNAVEARRGPGRPRLPKRGATEHADEPRAEICAITHEPVDVNALRDLASRREARFARLPGSNMTVREMIFYFLECCVRRETYENGLEVGILTVVWREGQCEQELGVKTRRYSGFEPFIAIEGAGGCHRGTFLALLQNGVPACFVGRSFFAVSKLLRWTARTRIPGVDIDQVNSHFVAQLRRHPQARCLGEYVSDRDRVLDEIIRKMGPDMHEEQRREAAKELFITLGYGGGCENWCKDYSVPKEAVPEFAKDFANEQRALRRADVMANSDLHVLARKSGHRRPDVKVQATLNLKAERETLDAMEAGLETSNACEIASFEHDGLFVWLPPWMEESVQSVRGWKEAMLRHALAGDGRLQLKAKPVPDFEDILARFAKEFQGDWKTATADWQEQLRFIQAARPGAQDARQDRLYAEIIAKEAEPYIGFAWSVRDLFKHAGRGAYYWFNVEEGRWRPADGKGRDKLLHVISLVLTRSLGPRWMTEFGDVDAVPEPMLSRTQESGAPKLFDNSTVLERVEKMSRALLVDTGFELDGEETRRYLRFTNGVFDLQEMCMRKPTPEMRLTNSTEWAYEGSGVPPESEDRLKRALRRVQEEEQTDGGLSSECEELLEGLSESFPDLGFIFSVCGSWARALYCLKHLARATFALKYQEMLITRGPGGNGKDTLANRLCVLLGSYFANLDSKALTVNRDMDAASQTFLALKAKRFVCVREIEKNATIKGNIYKTVSDYKSKIKARPLYGEDEEFYPHFLLFACTNVPLDIDDKGKGSKRRTRILDMPFNFVHDPQAANERRILPDLEDRFAEWNASLFFLLCQVRLILMSDAAGEVHPIPAEVADAVDEELREPWVDELDAFVRSRLEPTQQVALASTAAMVRDAFFKRCEGLEKREVALKLASQGFQEESKPYYDVSTYKRSTKRVYTYVFPGGSPGLVKLR